MHRDEGCYGQLGLLLSIGPTHHVNYWTSLADLVCNAESLENLSASNTAVRKIFFFKFETECHLSNFNRNSVLFLWYSQLCSSFCVLFIHSEYIDKKR